MSFIEDEQFDEINVEFAKKILEKKENEYIINTKYEGSITSEEIDSKTKKLEKIITKIKQDISSNKSNVYLNDDNYKELCNLAISK
jgi:predicted transcriptional regulator